MSLRTPPLLAHREPFADILDLIANGNANSTQTLSKPGYIIHRNWNPEFAYDMRVVNQYPEIWLGEKPENPTFLEMFEKTLHPYGVVDNPEQFIDRYNDLLSNDPRTFTVTLVHIPKDPDNEGNGGGWRWHKWGPYIGDGEPQCEYLDDEDGFDQGVYTYTIYEVEP